MDTTGMAIYPPAYYGSPYNGYYGSQYGGSPQYGYSPPPGGYKVLRSLQCRCKASRSRRSQDSLKRSSHHLPAEDRLF